jgi:hypothetical protein
VVPTRQVLALGGNHDEDSLGKFLSFQILFLEKKKNRKNITNKVNAKQLNTIYMHPNRDTRYQTDPSVRKEDWSVSNAELQGLLRVALPPADCCCSLLATQQFKRFIMQ